MAVAAIQEPELEPTTPSALAADATRGTTASLVAAGLDEKDAHEVDAWQQAMDEATMRVQEWAAQRVREEMKKTVAAENHLAVSEANVDAARTRPRPADNARVQIYFEADGVEFASYSMSLEQTVGELCLAMVRELALPLKPRLIFQGKLMDPAATLAAQRVNQEWLSFTYEKEQQLEKSLTKFLLEEQKRLNVSSQDWRRWLRIQDKRGIPLGLKWGGTGSAALLNNFDVILESFPIRVWLESKVLADLPPCVATCSEDSTCRIWNAATGHCEFVLRSHTDTVNSSCFALDNASVVTCSDDHTVKIWSLLSGECLHTLRGHTDAVSAALFSPDRRHLLTISNDCSAKMWNLQSLTCMFTLSAHTAPIYKACFNDDGTITTAGQDGKMLMWNGSNGRYMRALKPPLLSNELSSYSPDGRLTVTASPARETSIWDVDTGRCELVLGGHERQVTHAIFSPASAAMVACAKANAIVAKQQGAP